jgi:hypothetical protein
MKYQYLTVAGTALLSVAHGFPRMDAEQLKTYYEHSLPKNSAEGCPFAKKREKAAQPGCPFSNQKSKRAATFNAQEQHIDVSGQHAFIPPNFEAGDQRGPCPGLNALANHGFLPHNGVADMQTIIKATNDVYGMSLDLGGFLAVYGTVFDGNPLSTSPGYSIGGPSEFSQNILNGGGILGTPTGLSGSHNKYESDVSATRDDLYVSGNNYHVNRDRFIEYYNNILENTPAPEQYTALAPFHKKRFEDSVSTNGYFFYSPFAGVLVSPAAYSFPPRMMANHSEEYPEGYLDRQTFASFFGVEGDNEDNFVVQQGWERIPDNWYKRPIDDEFSIPDFLVDVLEHAAYYPRLLSFGGNTGKPNTFQPVDLGDLTGGVLNAATLLEGNNLECFAFQSILAAAPDLLGSTFTDVTAAMTPLLDKLMSLIGTGTCPQLEAYNQDLFNDYPGYTQAYGSYAGLSSGTLGGILQGVTGVLGGLIPTGNK